MIIGLDFLRAKIYIYIYGDVLVRVKVGDFTSIFNANNLNVRDHTPYSHSIVRVTLIRASPIYIYIYVWILTVLFKTIKN